jgi:acyl-CoA thioesterase FadM
MVRSTFDPLMHGVRCALSLLLSVLLTACYRCLTPAAYLTHAELARWELTSYYGMLQTMLKNNIHFLVVGTTIRYRREIRPLFSKFQIDTSVVGIDDRNLWMMHNFRSVSATKKESRIMAQMVVQGVAVQSGRSVMRPAALMKDIVGLNGDLVDSVILHAANRAATSESKVIEELLDRYTAMEETLKKASAEDDKKHR